MKCEKLIFTSTITCFIASALLVNGCQSPAPVVHVPDADLTTYKTTARLHFDRGEIASAAASYARALNRARVMDDPVAIADSAYNLAICQATLEKYADAMASLDEAEHEAIRAKLSPANILLVRARIYLLNKDPAGANDISDKILTRPDIHPTDAQRLQATLIKGQVAIQGSDLATARSQLIEAKNLADHLIGNISAQADVAGLSGDVHLLAKEFTAGRIDFDKQADLCRELHDYRKMERALAKAGRAAISAGDFASGADRLYRAARAAAAGGGPEAPGLVTEAAAAAQSSGDASLIRLSTSLATTQPSGK